MIAAALNMSESEDITTPAAFGRVLVRVREEKGASRHNAAKIAGVNEATLTAWEAGERLPSSFEFKKLLNILPRLRPYALAHLRLRREHGDLQFAPRADRPEQRMGKVLRHTAAAVPEVPAVFKDALRHMRTREGIEQGDLADLIDVTSQAVSTWETGRAVPVRVHFEALRELFPDLPEPPGILDIPPPDGGEGVPKAPSWRLRLEEAIQDRPEVPAALTEAVRPALDMGDAAAALAYLRGLIREVRRFVVVLDPEEQEPAEQPPRPATPVAPMPELPGAAGLGLRYAQQLVTCARLEREHKEAEERAAALQQAKEAATRKAADLLAEVQREATKEASR